MYRLLRAAYRFVTDGDYRSVWTLRLLKPKNLFQANNKTWADRYPVVFRQVREKLGDGSDLRLLSFGCATGEEVFTLRQYFPNAWIKGIDINSYNISVCRKRLAATPDPKISFEIADSVQRELADEYDGIFCMAVFRRGDLIDSRFTRCDSLICFQDFCRTVDEIARRLKPGGFLSMIHANFRFRDTPTADDFELAFRMELPVKGEYVTPIFDKENKRTDEFNCDEVIFRRKFPMPVID